MKERKITIRRMISISLLFLPGAMVSASLAAGAADSSVKGDLAAGATSWGQNCTRCHEMRSPTEFTNAQWRAVVAHMRMRGGLTGKQQRDILAFLQASNNPKPAVASVAPTGAKLASVAGQSGEAIYKGTCIACHGADGKGLLPGAPDFNQADGRLSKSDEVLLNHVMNGFQSPGSPMAMPAKGGNPDLSEADILAVLKYIRGQFSASANAAK